MVLFTCQLSQISSDLLRLAMQHCTLPPDPLEPLAAQDIVLDLEPAFTTTLTVECKRKQADIPLNIVLGHVRPSSNAYSKAVEEAAENTAAILANSWMNLVVVSFSREF